MAEEQMREEFEAWLRSLDGPRGDEPGYPASHELRYADQRAAAWHGFQAAWNRRAPTGAVQAGAVPTEQQMLDAAVAAGLFPNAISRWMPALQRYTEAMLAAAPSPAPVADDPIRQLGQEMLRITTTVVGLSLEDACAATPELWLHCMRERDELLAAPVAVAGQGAPSVSFREQAQNLANFPFPPASPAPHEGAKPVAEDDPRYPYHELRFIMRVLGHKGRAPRQDWETAYGMARSMLVRWAPLAAPQEPAATLRRYPAAGNSEICDVILHDKSLQDGARLYAAPQEHEARDAARWQPIETAPKDGTEILVSWPMRRLDDDGMQTDEITRRSSIVTSWAVGSSGWGEPAFLDASGGYYDDDDEFSPDPDLWQPLPAAPDAARAVKGGGAS